MSYLSHLLQSLPKEPGVYLFLNKQGDVIYVGKAKNLKNRVSSYFNNTSKLGEKTKQLVTQITKINHLVVASEIESLLLEANFIKKYNPKYNIRLTDNKSYPLIRITKKEKYPKILIARRMDDINSLYFGPYPNSSALKLVLRTIRRIFPYESIKNHPKKHCLYYHLGLCPCVEAVDTVEAKNEYDKTINYITTFLSGNTKKVIKLLQKERDYYAKTQEFEKASKIQNKIKAIELLTSPIRAPFDYETNPNLISDQREEALNNLQDALIKEELRVSRLNRIECYDISNTSGTNSTASMVVFTNGQKDSSSYRRFKIKIDGKPNDFAMLKEVLKRRFGHFEWPMPQLIIIDGGKGQVSSTLEILNTLNINIPLIGLAKREETIILPTLKELKLSIRNPALQLVMRIRDEAHRFAVTYHRKLRSKTAILT